MNVMQDSAKRDLVEGSGVERRLGSIGPFPEACLRTSPWHLRLASTRHHDPQCFVQIEVPLADWSFTGLAYFLLIALWNEFGQGTMSLC
jgi:hypothetical protein